MTPEEYIEFLRDEMEYLRDARREGIESGMVEVSRQLVELARELYACTTIETVYHGEDGPVERHVRPRRPTMRTW